MKKKGDNPMTQFHDEVVVKGNNRLLLKFRDHFSTVICYFKSILPLNFFYFEFSKVLK